MKRKLALLTTILFCFYYFKGQKSQQLLDSLSQKIATQHQAIKHWQDSFKNVQDSIRQNQLLRAAQRIKPINHKQQNSKKYLVIGATGVLILLFAGLQIMKKRKGGVS